MESSPAPLTSQEEELARLRKAQSFTLSNAAIDTRTPTMSGVSFPVSNAVIDSVNQMVKRKINYIQLRIGNYSFEMTDLPFDSFDLT